MFPFLLVGYETKKGGIGKEEMRVNMNMTRSHYIVLPFTSGQVSTSLQTR